MPEFMSRVSIPGQQVITHTTGLIVSRMVTIMVTMIPETPSADDHLGPGPGGWTFDAHDAGGAGAAVRHPTLRIPGGPWPAGSCDPWPAGSILSMGIRGPGAVLIKVP